MEYAGSEIKVVIFLHPTKNINFSSAISGFLYPDADPKNWYTITLSKSYESITTTAVFL
jgi:hypothetical protein